MARHYLTTPDARAAYFWTRYVMSESGCWEWTGPLYHHGYGQTTRIENARRSGYAHRTAWELTHGPVPDGMLICHSCDNRKCINPAHLFLGSYADNNQDCHDKGRGYSHFRGATHCKHGHEFTPENTKAITVRGYPGRMCRACQREHIRAYRATPKGRAAAQASDRRRRSRQREAVA